MTNLTDQLKQIADRAERATPGPWTIGHVQAPEDWYAVFGYQEESICETKMFSNAQARHAIAMKLDIEFIAHARTDIPRLLKALEYVLSGKLAENEPVKRHVAKILEGTNE